MSLLKRQTLPAENRIKKRQDYLAVQNRGLRLRTPHFYVYVSAGQYTFSRLGITASRRVGNAVVRNRVKRLVREYFRLNMANLPDGLDVSIIARSGAGRLNLGDVVGEMSVLQDVTPE